jgi:septum formation protein
MYSRWLNFLSTKKIILASGSTQRIRLLTELNFKFDSIPSDFPENLEKTIPKEYVEKTCLGKFEEFAKTNSTLPFDILITADSIVEKNGKIFEKPKDELEVYDMFYQYSNSEVICYTSVIIGVFKRGDISKGENLNELLKSVKFTNKTEVYFDELDDNLIADYIKSGQCWGKAGGFSIQGIASTFIKGINGCYNNVVGFPVNQFLKELDLLLIDAYGVDAYK